MIFMPLLVVWLWNVWYNETFDPMDRGSNNYSALANLYGKTNICNKDTLTGRYAVTCEDIYNFCSTPKPNIYITGSSSVDKTEYCNEYMSATTPFRFLFIPSVLASLTASIYGTWIVAKKLVRQPAAIKS